VKKCIILASIWESNFQFQRHLNGPKKAHNVYLTVQKSMKTSSNVFYKESVHIQDVAIKLTRVLKIMCYNHENGPKRTFLRKRTYKPFWPGDIPLVRLCIKLWLVRAGGTVRVTKCIILASFWESNSRFQWHLNGSIKA
jgi:hypothetical protein